jgi:hypothetical protein
MPSEDVHRRRYVLGYQDDTRKRKNDGDEDVGTKKVKEKREAEQRLCARQIHLLLLPARGVTFGTEKAISNGTATVLILWFLFYQSGRK